MVKKCIFIAAMSLLAAIPVFSQENEVRRMPSVNNQNLQKNYSTFQTGFWISAEAVGGYSCRLMNSNFAFAEIDVTGGYRFNEYLKIGVGFGGRYYFDNSKVRFSSSEWSFPLYANVRGNFIPTAYRSVVPYYSVDLGGTIRDGFLFRPAVGLRIGQQRNAFLVALAYTGQGLQSYEYRIPAGSPFILKEKKNKFVSFISLKLGYEF